jgi:aminoglycoside 6'-N-acetyltransferase I
MEIVDLALLTLDQRGEASRVLREALPGPAYQAEGEAEAQTSSFFEDPERFALAAIDGESVRGWVGGIRGYSHALELHPLVVDPPWQGRGVGRALVAALEARARSEGFLTLWLGTDDEVGGTSLFGAQLFPDALAKLATIAPSPAGHPFFFYRRLGFEPIGVLPDANGRGQPDILMAKPLAPGGSRRAG